METKEYLEALVSFITPQSSEKFAEKALSPLGEYIFNNETLLVSFISAFLYSLASWNDSDSKRIAVKFFNYTISYFFRSFPLLPLAFLTSLPKASTNGWRWAK